MKKKGKMELLSETVKELEKQTKELFERIKTLQTDTNELIQKSRRYESDLKAMEAKKRKEKEGEGVFEDRTKFNIFGFEKN